MKKSVLLFVLTYSILLVPQTNQRHTLIPVQGYGINLLSSSGNSSIDNNISNIGFINPAAISNFENLSFGLSYQASAPIKEGYIAEMGVKRIDNWMPQSAGAIYKIDNFSFGISFGQKYNGELSTGLIPVTTSDQPDGTGEFLEAKFRSRIQSYSAIASYSFPEIFNESSSLQFGFRYSYNQLKYHEELYKMTIDESDDIGSYAIGLQYSTKLSDEKTLRIGFSYDIEPNFGKSFIVTYDSLLIPDPDPNNRTNSGITFNYSLVGYIPDKLNLDVSADLSESLRLNAMITGILWETDDDLYKNQLEFSSSGVYRLNEMFTPSLGFYFTNKRFSEDYFKFNEKMNALFLIAGLNIRYNIFSADIVIADSHLFSGDYRKETIGKLSIGINL